MFIDCTDQECPKPVIESKNALEKLKDDEILEVLLNTQASVENVKRFALSQSCEVDEKADENGTLLSIRKNCNALNALETKSKVLFIKDDKIGEGELGSKLMMGFLATLLEIPNKPEKIFLVNNAVKLSTQNENTIKTFRSLINLGVKVYSCGVCLDHFNLSLKVGEVGNAYEVVLALMNSKVVSLG